MNRFKTRRNSRGRRWRGIATVEMAICLPLMVTITFGAIEAANFIYMKQALTEATYECARIATNTAQTKAEAELRFKEIVDARGMKGTKVTISPQVDAKTPPGTIVTVDASLPAKQNTISPLMFFKNKNLTAKIVMVRL